MKKIPGTIYVLGWISLFSDVSSEMIYPLIPLFLTSVLGQGAFALGIIEGIAEATASIFKIVSGIWTDKTRRRKPFILAGYGLAGLARPLIGLAGHWVAVLALRFTDRVGKGIRTSPRDALIADVAAPEQLGAAYGVQRSMDHAGAVMGPLIAGGLLMFMDLTLRQVFLMAAIPALLCFSVAAFNLKEPPVPKANPAAQPIGLTGWNRLSKGFKFFLLTVFVFTLGNSTDAFLILRLGEVGVPAGWVAVLWSVHHIVKMIANYYGGKLSDKIGHRVQLGLGWAIYALIYLSFAAVDSPEGLIGAFIAYGVYFGFAEPSEKALVAQLAPPELRGSAFGYFHFAIGLAALPASLVFGIIWKTWGAPTAFLTGAALALTACGMLALGKFPKASDLVGCSPQGQ